MATVELSGEFITAPVASYARLRAQAPVHRAITPEGTEVWLVTRYADVRAALEDPRLSVDAAHAADACALDPAGPAPDLLGTDPPLHTRLRGCAAQALRVHHLRPRVAEIAAGLVDEFAAAGSAELVGDYARPLSAAVLADLLGVPAAQRPEFRDRAGGPAEPLQQHLAELIAAKRAHPGDDLISALLAQDELSGDEVLALTFRIVSAGHQKATDLLGNGLAALLQHPEQLATLHADPPLLERTAIDELLRFDPPQQAAIRRFPLSEVDIGGVVVPAGATVLLSLMSAHHDPAAFADPEALDITRDDNPHLAFGRGPHFCLGAQLAQMQAELGIGTILRRLPDLAATEPPEHLRRRQSWRHRGLVELPVAFRPR